MLRAGEPGLQPGSACYHDRAMGRLVLACALVCAGCAGPVDSGRDPITVRGRVVDAETCASTAGCQGVPGVVVALLTAAERVRSEPTGLEGAFELSGVPAGGPHHLVGIPQDTAAARWAATINPMAVDSGEDVFGLELYVLPQDSDALLTALRAEGIDLVATGGYIGQVVVAEGATLTAVEGVGVSASPPQGEIRYVQVLPRYVPDEPALKDPGATTTSAFGLFVVPSGGGSPEAVRLAPSGGGSSFEWITTPLRPGLVSFAIHRAL